MTKQPNPRAWLKRSALAPLASLAALLAPASQAAPLPQNGSIPGGVGQEFRPVHGGDTRQVFTIGQGLTARYWAAEDGGRIRYSHDGSSTWQYANTPADFTHSLMDVWFLDADNGWACGQNGIMLSTVNGGVDWGYLPDIASQTSNTLWRVRFLDANRGIAAGIGVLYTTTNGGQDWSSVDMIQSDNGSVATAGYEFYGLDVLVDGGQHIALASAQRTTGHRAGVIFRAVDSLSLWKQCFHDENVVQSEKIWEPWDLEFLPGATLTKPFALVAGGLGPNKPGAVYCTDDGGVTWDIEADHSVINDTIYGLGVNANGAALACGYNGANFERDPVTMQWTRVANPPVGGGSVHPTDPNFVAPLNGCIGLGGQRFLVGGSWGFLRATLDRGTSWIYINDTYDASNGEKTWRLLDQDFLGEAPLTGYVCGERSVIAKTTDGGTSWQFLVPLDYTNLGANYEAIEFHGLRGVVAGGTIRVTANGAGGFTSTSLMYTPDGGTTWLEAEIPASLEQPFPNDDRFVDVCFAGSGWWWAVTAKGKILYSTDEGVTWSFPLGMPTDPTYSYSAVDSVSSTQVVVVGRSGGSAIALRSHTPGVGLWLNVLGTTAGPIADVDFVGTDFGTATGYAVGKNGKLLSWNGSTFQSVSLPQGVRLGTNLVSVAIDPDDPTHVLVGAEFDAGPSETHEGPVPDDAGWMMRHTIGDGWQRLRSFAGKNVRDIELVPTPGEGGRTGIILAEARITSASFDNGSIADSLLLRYDRAPDIQE